MKVGLTHKQWSLQYTKKKTYLFEKFTSDMKGYNLWSFLISSTVLNAIIIATSCNNILVFILVNDICVTNHERLILMEYLYLVLLLKSDLYKISGDYN